MDFLMEIQSKNHPTCSRMSFPSHLLWRLMALLFILAEISQRIIGCPETCACFTPSEVHCAFRYLSEAPRGINKAVQRVNLGYNSLSGIKMSDFSGLKRLELLMLHSNTIKTIEDSSFCDLASLQVLKMSYNKVEKLNKDTFNGLDNLVRLHVDNNLITFIHPESFYGLKMLQLINLEGNQLQQLHPDTFITLRFGQILKWSSFKTIYLSDNALRTLPAALLSGSSMIENLFLSGNPWSCDCRMSWLAEWIKKQPGVLKCKSDKKFLKDPCPICQFLSSSRDQKMLHLQSDGFVCDRPWIQSALKQRNFTIGDEDYTMLSPKDFVAPIGMWEMNITDQLQHSAHIACVVQRPTTIENLTAIFGINRKDINGLSARISTLLVCNIDYDNIQKVWDILATYSDFPMTLVRELSLSSHLDTYDTYKQVPATPDAVFTDTEVKIKATPEWLLQDKIMLQLERTTTTFPTITIKHSSNVQLHNVNRNGKEKYSWTMIKWDNQTKTEHVVLVGGATKLICPTFGDPEPVVEWIFPDGSKMRAPYNTEDQRVVITHEGSLHLKSAQISDSGVYHCIATNYLDADVLDFRVTVMPTDIEEEYINGIKVSYTLGQKLSLDCTPVSTLQASIHWILPDHTTLDKSHGKRELHQNGTLIINNLTSRDRGFYRCVASNILGIDLLASYVIVKEDLTSNTTPTLVKEPNNRGVQIIDDSQETKSSLFTNRLRSEESRRITSGRPYQWLQSRFQKLSNGRRWNGRNSRRLSRKMIQKTQNKGASNQPLSLRIKSTSHDTIAGSGDGISEDEFIVMATTQALDRKFVSTIKNTEIPKISKMVNNAFIELNPKSTSIILQSNEKTKLATPLSNYETPATPVMVSYTLSSFRAQKNKQSITKSDYTKSYIDIDTHKPESSTEHPPRTPTTLKSSLRDASELLFSGDSEDITTGSTTVHTFKGPNVTYLEPQSQTIFTALTTAEENQEKITFQTTQRITSELIPGSTIISKHQIQIVPSKRILSGKRRKFHGQRRIIRPSKIEDIQSLLEKFKHLTPNTNSNLTFSGTTTNITDCETTKMFTSGSFRDKCLKHFNQSLVNSTSRYLTTISSLNVTDNTIMAGSGKINPSIGSSTIVSGATDYNMHLNAAIKEPDLGTTTMLTPTVSSTTAQRTNHNQRVFKPKGYAQHDTMFTISPEWLMKIPYKSTTSLPTTEYQVTQINTSSSKKKGNIIEDASSGDSSGSSPITETDFSDVIIPSKNVEIHTFPASHELSTTKPTDVSNTLLALPTIKTQLKQNGRNVFPSQTRFWGKQNPGYNSRRFRGRKPNTKMTPNTQIATVPSNADIPFTTLSKTAEPQIKHRGGVLKTLNTPLKESTRHLSTVDVDSGTTVSTKSVSTLNPGHHSTVPSFPHETSTARLRTNFRSTTEKVLGYTTQRPLTVVPTTHKQVNKVCIKCLQQHTPALFQKKKVTSTDSTAFTTPFPYTSHTSVMLNSHDYSTKIETSTNSHVISKPVIGGGKAASFTVLSNSDAFLPCEATGNPQPIISWNRYTTGKMLVIKGKMGKFEVLKNGTLLIQRTNIKDQGQYICNAQNKFGSDKLVVTLSVVAYPTRILETRIRDLKVIAGKTVTLECRTEGRPEPVVSWILPNHTEVRSPNTGHGRVIVSSVGTLTIQQVSVLDHGPYKCIASNPGGTDTATVYLQVAGTPPVILEEKQQEVKAYVGQNLFLPCTTQGNPKPAIRWILHDGRTVFPQTYSNNKVSVFENGTVYLRDVEINQSGKYECIAANSMGADHRVVTFSVMKKDTVPKIISTSQYQTVVVYGGHLHLNCSAAGDPKPRILWRIPSKGLVDQSNRMGSSIKVLENGSLIIESVTEKDAGDFLCVASNKLGEDVQLMRVSISMKPARIEPKAFGKKQVLYGNDVKVDCVAAGLPIPEISWGLPDGTLVNSALQADGAEGDPFRRYVLFDNGTLFLNKVGTDEEGDYTCYAENKLGKDQMHIHISVISAAPHIQPPDLSQAKVKPGGNIRFDCKAIGEPKPKILWMLPSKDIIAASNERFLVHANGSLDIRNIKLSDVGEYVCMARSSAGEDTNVYKLDLDGNSPVINGFNQNRTVVKNTAIKFSRKLIDCQAEGNPPPKITWVMPDNIFLTAPYYGSRINVHRNGTLEIRNVRPSDTAEFICIAQNDGGEAVMLVQLEVTENLRRPIFNNPFNERVVTKVGGTAVLNCSADGHPKPEILWTLPNRTAFTGGPGTFGSRYLLEKDGTLVICNSTSEDTGKYRCAAKNKVGYIEKLVVLEVIRKPYILTRPKGIIRALSGESLFLHCLTDGVKSTISWSTPGGLILPHKKVIGRYNLLENGTLVVRETTMRDRGNYVCRAKNDAGEAVLAVSVLIVAQSARITNGPPPTLKGVSGVPVQLKCVANGIPTPDIIWELPDHTILSTTGKGQSLGKEHLHAHGTLIIRKPTIGHSGNYKCIAFNYLGRDTSTTFLTIL